MIEPFQLFDVVHVIPSDRVGVVWNIGPAYLAQIRYDDLYDYEIVRPQEVALKWRPSLAPRELPTARAMLAAASLDGVI